MSETWIPDMQVWGDDREKALAECERQIAEWGLTMPEVEPLATDFGLKDFRTTGLIEYWVVNAEDAGYCGKFLFVFDGQTCPEHSHDVKHETFFVVKGRVKMVLNGEAQTMKEGDRLVMNTATRHAFTGIGNALLLEVSMPSTLEDNFFTDKQIGREGVI